MAADADVSGRPEAGLEALRGELRAPVAGILGGAELLLKSVLDPEQDRHVRDIQRCAQALLRLVDAPVPVETRAGELLSLTEPPLAQRRILVVRDCHGARQSSRALLERWGARVSSIDSAEQAFAFLEAGRRWDAAVIDAALDGDPGRRLAQRLLESPARVERLVALLPEKAGKAQAHAWRSRGARALACTAPPGALLHALTERLAQG